MQAGQKKKEKNTTRSDGLFGTDDAAHRGYVHRRIVLWCREDPPSPPVHLRTEAAGGSCGPRRVARCRRREAGFQPKVPKIRRFAPKSQLPDGRAAGLRGARAAQGVDSDPWVGPSRCRPPAAAGAWSSVIDWAMDWAAATYDLYSYSLRILIPTTAV